MLVTNWNTEDCSAATKFPRGNQKAARLMLKSPERPGKPMHVARQREWPRNGRKEEVSFIASNPRRFSRSPWNKISPRSTNIRWEWRARHGPPRDIVIQGETLVRGRKLVRAVGDRLRNSRIRGTSCWQNHQQFRRVSPQVGRCSVVVRVTAPRACFFFQQPSEGKAVERGPRRVSRGYRISEIQRQPC